MAHGTTAGPATTLHPLHIQNPYYDETHDPYFLKAKLTDGSTCRECGVVFRKGGFHWEKLPAGNATEIICPACRRSKDKYAGGSVWLEGEFVRSNLRELHNLVANIEKAEKGLHPLERIMFLEEDDGVLQILTTYEHLARRIGEAVHRAYKGDLHCSYAEDEKFVRIRWTRD